MITQFIACDNQLSDMKEVAHCLTAWPAIWRLDLQGNPICMKSKYRDRIIIMAPKLGKIESKIFFPVKYTLCCLIIIKNAIHGKIRIKALFGKLGN